MNPSWLTRRFPRRDFLKLSAVGALAAWLPPVPRILSDPTQQLGRILDPSIPVYDAPSKGGKMVRIVWRDLVVPILGTTVGEDTTAYNRVWYQIEGGGYVYSGNVQPVRLRVNAAADNIPEMGQLAEVTVPFTDTRWKPDPKANKAYRIYYNTTHWVTGLETGDEGSRWYRLFDDKWKLDFYALAQHLRLFPAEELSPLSPEIPLEGKRLEVRLADQAVIAYEWDRAVYMARAATGGVFKSGSFPTPEGRFTTFHKRPTRHMAAGDRAAPDSYDLPGVPWVCYFTPSGVSFHGTFWHNDFGHPRSHGCINLTPAAAQWIYRWTSPVVPPGETYVYEDYGTTVDIL